MVRNGNGTQMGVTNVTATTGTFTVFYTGKEDHREGYVGGVFGTWHDAETRTAVLYNEGTALATWIEKRAPTQEEMDHDAYLRGVPNDLDDAKINYTHSLRIVERSLDAIQHLYESNPELYDVQRAILSHTLSLAAQDMARASQAIIDAKKGATP